eukprot:5209629-Amphidinium_carterae.1
MFAWARYVSGSAMVLLHLCEPNPLRAKSLTKYGSSCTNRVALPQADVPALDGLHDHATPLYSSSRKDLPYEKAVSRSQVELLCFPCC